MQLKQLFAHISIVQNHPECKGDICVILLKNNDFSTYSYLRSQLKKFVSRFATLFYLILLKITN